MRVLEILLQWDLRRVEPQFVIIVLLVSPGSYSALSPHGKALLFYLIISPVPTCLVHNCEISRRLIISICCHSCFEINSLWSPSSCGLSANLVGPGFEGGDSSRPRLSAIVMRSSVWEEWCLKLGSQSLSLMLKSPVKIIVLSMFVMFSRRAQRAVWLLFEYMLIMKLVSRSLWKARTLISRWFMMSSHRANLILARHLLT